MEARLLSGGELLHALHLVDVEEVTQVLRRYERASSLTSERGQRALADLVAFPLHRYSHDGLLPRMWELRRNVTAYDAAYLALAEALLVPPVSCDARLASAPGHNAKMEAF